MSTYELRRRSRSLTEGGHNPSPRFNRPLGQIDVPTKPPSATALENVYQQLHISLSTSPISFRIPETLIISEEGFNVLLFTDERGSLQVYEGKEHFQEFVTICAEQVAQEQDRGEFPLYVFSTDSGRKSLWTPAEAEKAWNSSLDHTKMLQRYVLPRLREPCRIRVIWKENEIKRFRIKKRGIESVLQHLRVRQRPSLKPGLHEPLTPTMPRRSLIEDSVVQSEYECEEMTTILIERCHMVLREVLGGLLREDEAFIELAYDVMQDSQDRIVFLNACWSQVGQPIHTARDIRAKFNSLMATKVPSAIPFVDLKEVQAQNVQLYLNRFSTIAGEQKREMTHNAESPLEQTSSKLDLLVQNASATKQREVEQQCVRLESYHNEQLLECIVSRVYSKVLAEPMLQSFFNSMSRREMNMIKQGFVKAFAGVDNYYFKRTVKRVHEGLGIERAQFTRFVELFIQSMQEEGVRSSDIEIVSRHLNHFSDEVIEDDGT